MDVVKLISARRALFARLAIAFVALAVAHCPAMAQAQSGGPGVPVTAAKVTRQDVPILLRGLGTVQAYYSVQLRSRVDGTLTEVSVREGQDVKKDDVLAVIDPRPYQAALDAVLAKRQQDQAQLANAQADLARYASLMRQDFASRQQVETQTAMVKQFTAAIAGDDAQIEVARLNLDFCRITAPFDGRVGLRNLDPGNLVHSSEATPILSLTQVQPITVVFTLPQDNLPLITTAMQGGALDVVVTAGNDSTDLDRGKLITIDNSIDTTTGTIRLKAAFGNAKRALWPGQFVNARLSLGVDANAVTVPVSAVQHGPNGLFVYKVGDNGVVSAEPITVSRQEGKIYVVTSGITDGATVVTDGQSRLQAGAHVVVRNLPGTGSGTEPAKTAS